MFILVEQVVEGGDVYGEFDVAGFVVDDVEEWGVGEAVLSVDGAL